MKHPPDGDRPWRRPVGGIRGGLGPLHGVRLSTVLATDASRRLLAAQLMGAGAFAALGQIVIHMPEGHFGALGEVTSAGAAFALLQLVLFSAWWWTRLGNRRLVYGIAGSALLINIGTFALSLGSDPVLAGSVVLWHVLLLSQLLFPSPPLVMRPKPGDLLGQWLATHGAAARHFLMVSLVASIAMVGYRESEQVFALAICLALDAIAIVLSFPLVLQLWRQGSRFRVPALASLFLLGMLFSPRPALTLIVLAIYQLVVLLLLVVRLPSFISAGEIFFGRPEFLVVWTFCALIGVGTLLLSLPIAANPGKEVPALDAFFLATSAACVSGLATVDVAQTFSTFGHVVIILLAQVGGLNIMVLSAFASILLGRGLSLRGEKVLGEMLDLQPERSVYPLVRFIVVATLAIEAIGALIIATSYLGRGDTFGEAIWKGAFHSISAFCNAGFALHPDNLISFQRDWVMLPTICVLVTLGGFGFSVLAAFWARWVRRRRNPWATQVRMVLWASGVLIVLGTLLVAGLEWNASLAGMNVGEKWLNALMKSVTTRTAGFNTLQLDLLRPVTLFIMLAWMFIGASPGGTGGGIKTTTATVLLSVIPAIARGRTHVVFFGRALPLEIVYRSAAIAVVSVGSIFVATAVLLATQRMPLDVVLFEVVSALSTAGMTLGATPLLDQFGKIVIIFLMFLGRVGPLTLALLLARQEASRVSHPEARVMVG
jgi:trk system potassium uptake protein TrkH